MVFRIDEVLLKKAERDLSERMESFWTEFARTGQPADAATWPQYSTASDLSLRLNTGTSVALPGLKNKECNFWDAFEPSVPP